MGLSSETLDTRSNPIWVWPSLCLLFAMVFLPTAYQPLKGALLFVVLVIAGGAALRMPSRTIHRQTLIWSFSFALVGLLFMLRGLARGEPGALRVGSVYVAWPLAFLTLVACAPRGAAVRRHLGVLVAATLAVVIYGLEFVLEQGGWIPRSIFPDLFPDQGVGFHEGFIELRLPSLAVLPFALPFLVAAAVAWARGRAPVQRRWVWLALSLGLLLAALSGRRAVLLVVALAPILTLALLGLLPGSDRKQLRAPTLVLSVGLGLGVVGIGAFLGEAYGFDSGLMWDMFREGFDPSASESSSIRATQLRELLRGWGEAPLLGSGHGSFVRAHIRDVERPWSYELSYPTLLFQTGLVGVLLYAALVGWLYWQVVRMIRGGGEAGLMILPLAVGLTTFLIANATNPYLLKFDFMWVVFLPLALINRWLVDQQGAPPAPVLAGNP